MKAFTKTISILFHPLLIPTWTYFALFNSGYYFSMLSWDLKRFVLIAVFFTTGLLPLLTMSIMALSPGFNFKMDSHTNRIKPLFFAAIYYYLGYYLLRGITIYPVFRVFLITSVIVIVLLMIISFKWKISIHMAGIGGLTGTILAISFRMGINPLLLIIIIILVAGVVGSSRLYLKKNSLAQLITGFGIGLGILYLAVYFV
ncbi:MAG: hypothetical protein JXR31_14375 [Prolixibacteraceae bacterium]|nr:hypothetical protein [Prolixibacteraceae bacterium]MBN2775437.1 hypothetical protein [Prolixibacteraceae bacterium]